MKCTPYICPGVHSGTTQAESNLAVSYQTKQSISDCNDFTSRLLFLTLIRMALRNNPAVRPVLVLQKSRPKRESNQLSVRQIEKY